MAEADDIPTDLALEIGEDLEPSKFLAAVRDFVGLVNELVQPADGQPDFDWRIKVRQGSNIVALDAPKVRETNAPFAALNAMQDGTHALVDGQLGAPVLTDKALGFAKRLSDIGRSSRGIVPIRIWVRRIPFNFGPEIAEHIREAEHSSYHDYGTLEGTLNAIADRNGVIEIKVADPIWPQAIPCKVSDRQLPAAMAAFRKRVELAGLINYNRLGRPTSISVERLERLPDDSTLPTAQDVRGLLA